jgi:hypothetical protein
LLRATTWVPDLAVGYMAASWQIMLLKGPDIVPFRDAVSSALERRHAEVRKLWTEALEGVGIATPRSE